MPDLIRELLLHYRDLLRHLTHRLRNPDEAADIAQTSFEQVFLHATASPGAASAIESPRALLFRTAHNLCIDQARHRQVVQAWSDDRMAQQAERMSPSAEHIAAHRQLVARVVAQLEALPPRRREVFLLFRAYGHTQTEIAQRLNITEAAVAKHVVRATVDCARVFAELSQAMPTSETPLRNRLVPSLAEECR
ncbi:MAG: sigma-70 family RNA polymerase sigma factor [Rubrivivax sp.]|nr:MAG: sigma-70 family RNA polymerase sigma factor [Rubrivivax sp.]